MATKKTSLKVMSKSKDTPSKVTTTTITTTPQKRENDNSVLDVMSASPYRKYDEAAEYDYYDRSLRDALRAKNPAKYDALVQAMGAARQGGAERWNIQKMIPQDYAEKLSTDEIKQVLSKLKPVEGKAAFERFQQLRKAKELGGTDYGWAERSDFSDYSPRDLSIDKTTSFGDRDSYYRPEVKEGRLLRSTNIPAALAVMGRR